MKPRKPINIHRIILDILEKYPDQTAGEIWRKILMTRKKDMDEFRSIKVALFDEDQTIRVLLRQMEEDQIVTHSVRHRSILKEWRRT